MVCGLVVGGRGGKGGGPALEIDVGRSLLSLSFSRTSSSSSLVDSPPAQGTSVFCAPDVMATTKRLSSNDEAGGAARVGKRHLCVFVVFGAPAARLHHGSIVTSTPSTRRQLDGVTVGVSHPSAPSPRRLPGRRRSRGRRAATARRPPSPGTLSSATTPRAASIHSARRTPRRRARRRRARRASPAFRVARSPLSASRRWRDTRALPP